MNYDYLKPHYNDKGEIDYILNEKTGYKYRTWTSKPKNTWIPYPKIKGAVYIGDNYLDVFIGKESILEIINKNK